ncbi:lipase/acyltransferase domain-containing protein [Bacillus toyonensis]|uniref:lipase/acyltransferase domain-containing protein n=1 Tax=Bacillus toyonensis TaxID=155322 RepID=UPI000BEDA95A|nr:hypothetical protein [Bacillus toyonensis]PEB20354.1 hypothetical protein COO08_02260 [Bacillus toyonensis]PEF99874.1 hypothetical protein COO01_05810 [Bacillus toyonensis]PHD95047.1 hypothetical protein COF55_01350 [Bacillus toyonensis]
MTKCIFVPGIKGSELYEGNNKRWFSATTKDFYALDLENELTPSSLLSSVNAYFFMRLKLYEGIEKRFTDNEESDITFIDYPYDWRKSLLDIVDEFVDFIIDASENDDDIILIAHSMGGLLSKLAILKIQERGLIHIIKKLITIGTPWKGSPEAYKVLEYGEPGAYSNLAQIYKFLNDKDTRSLARKLPSTYQLLPSEDYFNEPYGNFIISAERPCITYEDVKTKIQQIYNEENKKVEEDRVLDVWKKYIEPVHEAMKKPLPVEHDCLIGIDHPTLYTFPEKSYSFMRMYKAPSLIKNGDGVVPFNSAIPYHEANLYHVNALHRSQCSDQNVLDFIEWIIQDKNGEQPIGIGKLDLTRNDEIELIENMELKKGFLATVMCPVETTILDKNHNYVAGVIDPSLENYSSLIDSDEVQYIQVGDAKYLYSTKQEDLDFEINAYKEGIAEVAVEIFDEEEPQEIQFSTIPITPKKSAKLSIRREQTNAELPTVELQHDNKYLEPKITKKRDKVEIPSMPVPKIELKCEYPKGTKKTPYVHVYSGPVTLIVDTQDLDSIGELLYSIDGKSITHFKGNQADLDLPSGSYILQAFGKDIYGRTLKSNELIIRFDKSVPQTRLNLRVHPEYCTVQFEVKTYGSKYTTYYQFVDYDGMDKAVTDEWAAVPNPGGEIKIPYEIIRKLREDKNKKYAIQFYSENEFGLDERVKTLVFAIGDLSAIMWSDVISTLTAKAIFRNVTGSTLTLNDEEIQIEQKINKKYLPLNPEVSIGDNVQSILFSDKEFVIEVFYSEKYSLYFSGPPTELLDIGQEYTFSFELRTEKTKDQIFNTNPQARLKPMKPGGNVKVQRIQLKHQNGVFSGSFTVGELFRKYKHKLVITDDKNTNPPLRESVLMLREDEK